VEVVHAFQMDTPPSRPSDLPLTPSTTTPAPTKSIHNVDSPRYGNNDEAGPSSPLKRGLVEDYTPDLGWYVPIQRAKRVRWREGGFGVERQDQMEGIDVG
jgi:hypothetical protein